MRQATVIRYSMSFKQQVIRELEAGRFQNVSQAREHYGINGAGTIPKWLARYGRNHLCSKVVRIEMANERDQVVELKKQIRQLKEALGHTQAENVINQAFLKIACERLGLDVEDFKKKADMMRSVRQEKGLEQV